MTSSDVISVFSLIRRNEMIEYKLKAIEEKHLLSTLLYLYENGESIKTEI